MVSYDSLFQYTLVLLTVILVTLALIKRENRISRHVNGG